MPTLTNTVPSTTRKKIVLNRWKARNYYWEAWKDMPTTIQIRNDKEGRRLAEEDMYDVSLTHTLNMLCEIGQKIFFRNHKKHYVGISVESLGRISYCDIEEHKFNSNSRIKTRLGRYITRNFQEIIEEEEFIERALDMLVEKFTALAAEDMDSIFKTVTGRELIMRYRDEFADDSCMSGSGARYTEMYGANPDVVSMLCLDDGRYRGRALLWNTDNGQVLDRIYPNSGPHIEKYVMYCNKHEIDMRYDNYCPSSSPEHDTYPRFQGVQTKAGKTYSVTVKVPNTHNIPYMDLFHYGNWADGNREEATTAQIYSDPTADGAIPDFIASGTGGETSNYDYTNCTHCQEDVFLHATQMLCDEYGKRDNTQRTCNECMHDAGVKQCEACDRRMMESNSIIVKGIQRAEYRYCVPCAISRLLICKGCNEVHGHYIELNDEKYCKDCYLTALAKSITQTQLEKELAIKESIRNE